MINRRAFLKISGLISAAFSLLPFSFAKKLQATTIEPISEAITYFAESRGDVFVLHNENPYEAKPPEITYSEYLRDYYGQDPEEMVQEDFEDFGISKKQLNDICPVEWYEDSWWEYYSSSAGPYYDFWEYKYGEKEIGKSLHDKISWVEGAAPGNDYTAMEFQDKETVLEFQKKLKKLGNPLNIEFVNW